MFFNGRYRYAKYASHIRRVPSDTSETARCPDIDTNHLNSVGSGSIASLLQCLPASTAQHGQQYASHLRWPMILAELLWRIKLSQIILAARTRAALCSAIVLHVTLRKEDHRTSEVQEEVLHP